MQRVDFAAEIFVAALASWTSQGPGPTDADEIAIFVVSLGRLLLPFVGDHSIHSAWPE